MKVSGEVMRGFEAVREAFAKAQAAEVGAAHILPYVVALSESGVRGLIKIT
jgi:hypothetical protein